MTVKQLIELLKQEDAEAQVHFAYPSGDHWRTVVCPEVTDVTEGFVKHSDYHNKPQLLSEDEADQDDENTAVVVVLS